jgi:tryptophan synthase alpha chain
MTVNRIDAAFDRLRATGRKGLIPFVAAGDPSLEQTAALVRELERRGADIVELGVPFSDPLADGPVNQRAYQRGLRAGASVPAVLTLVAEIRRTADVPLVLMSYLNPLHRFGLDRFPKAAHDAGVDGLILCDAPPEETEPFRRALHDAGLHLIQLVAPTTPAHRIAWIGQRAAGYLYYVSLRGVTGPRERLPEDLGAGIQRVRAATRIPVAVGFGISTPAQAAEAAALADAVIVGSALVAVLERGAGAPDLVSRAGAFVAELRAALPGG